jgi:hypothetical protein
MPFCCTIKKLLENDQHARDPLKQVFVVIGESLLAYDVGQKIKIDLDFFFPLTNSA